MAGNKLNLKKTGQVLSGIIILLAAGTANAGVFKMQASDAGLFGERALASGDFERSADRLEKRLEQVGSARSMRAPALNNLCIAYTMNGQAQQAREACDAAVSNGRDVALAYNNRGVMHIAAGDYAAALTDFQASINAPDTPRVARDNLQLVQQRLAWQSEQGNATVADTKPIPASDGA